MIVGPPKVGKTTFAENLAISLSIGRKEFFGYKLDGEPKKVLFVNLEEPYKLRARRNGVQISNFTEAELELFSNNFDTTDKDFLEFLNDDNDWNKLSKYIESSDSEIVFIDSLTNMFSGKIEDSTVSRNFIEKFSYYLKSLNKTFIVVHHTTKGNETPPEQSNVAGSRVILQYFEFIYALWQVPNEAGYTFLCNIQNKHVQKDSSSAYLYNIDENYWVSYLGKENMYSLYKDSVTKFDGRYDDTNENLMYDYFVNQYNQGIQTISTSTMMKDLVLSKEPKMSHDTLHKVKNKLLENGKLEKLSKGNFRLNNIEENLGNVE